MNRPPPLILGETFTNLYRVNKRMIVLVHRQKYPLSLDGTGLSGEAVDGLRAEDVFQARKTERLYVIKGLTFDGLDIYTKGKILTKEGVDVFYVLISSKRSTDV